MPERCNSGVLRLSQTQHSHKTVSNWPLFAVKPRPRPSLSVRSGQMLVCARQAAWRSHLISSQAGFGDTLARSALPFSPRRHRQSRGALLQRRRRSWDLNLESPVLARSTAVLRGQLRCPPLVEPPAVCGREGPHERIWPRMYTVPHHWLGRELWTNHEQPPAFGTFARGREASVAGGREGALSWTPLLRTQIKEHTRRWERKDSGSSRMCHCHLLGHPVGCLSDSL